MKSVRVKAGRAATEDRHRRGKPGEAGDHRPISVSEGTVDLLIRMLPELQKMSRRYRVVKWVGIDHPVVIQHDEVLNRHR